jgi:nucleoid DNA-binding protein
MALFLKSDFFVDKPVSLSVKDYLIRKMAVKLRVSEKVIESVVNHQFSSANEALKHNKSIEISGFGKFFFNEKKALKKLMKNYSKRDFFQNALDTQELSETKRRNYYLKLQSTLEYIKDLKPRVYENRTDLRGLEKQSAASQEVESGDSKGEQTEDGDLQSMSSQFPE